MCLPGLSPVTMSYKGAKAKTAVLRVQWCVLCAFHVPGTVLLASHSRSHLASQPPWMTDAITAPFCK